MLLKKKRFLSILYYIISKYIIDDIDFSSDSNRQNSDEENSNEENFDEENFKKDHNFFLYIYKNGKLILSKNKEKLWKEAHKRYQNLFLKKKKKKKHQYHCDQNKNLYEEEKQKKVEYMRNYYVAHKK